jgi:hypothetical protein
VEIDTRPGAVRDRIAAFQVGWMELMTAALTVARSEGELDPEVELGQLAFELNALLGQANAMFLMFGSHEAFELARRGVRERLERAGSAPAHER